MAEEQTTTHRLARTPSVPDLRPPQLETMDKPPSTPRTPTPTDDVPSYRPHLRPLDLASVTKTSRSSLPITPPLTPSSRASAGSGSGSPNPTTPPALRSPIDANWARKLFRGGSLAVSPERTSPPATLGASGLSSPFAAGPSSPTGRDGPALRPAKSVTGEELAWMFSNAVSINNDAPPSRFLVIGKVPTDLESPKLQAALDASGDIDKCFTTFQASRGLVIVAFFDIRKAIEAQRTLPTRLLFGSRRLSAGFISSAEVEKMVGSAEVVDATSSDLVITSEGVLDLDALRKTLSSYGQVASFTPVRHNMIRISYYDYRDAETAINALERITIEDGPRLHVQRGSHGSSSLPSIAFPPATSPLTPTSALPLSPAAHEPLRRAANASSLYQATGSASPAAETRVRIGRPLRSPLGSPIKSHGPSSSLGAPADFHLSDTSMRQPFVEEDVNPRGLSVDGGSHSRPRSVSASGQVEETPAERAVVRETSSGLHQLNPHSPTNALFFDAIGYSQPTPSAQFASPPERMSDSSVAAQIPVTVHQTFVPQLPAQVAHSAPPTASSQPQHPFTPSSEAYSFYHHLMPRTGYEYVYPGYHSPQTQQTPTPTGGAQGSYYYTGGMASPHFPIASGPETPGGYIQLGASALSPQAGYLPYYFPEHHAPAVGAYNATPVAVNAPASSAQFPLYDFGSTQPSYALNTPAVRADVPVIGEQSAQMSHGGSGRVASHPIPAQNVLDLERIASGLDTRTTVMVKNIPNKMTDQDLIEFINDVCPCRVDFLYLRMDFSNGCNVGYAFVNFILVDDLLHFAKARLGVKWNKYSSEKVLQMSYANYQGKEACVEKFRNSCIMDEKEAWRPKLFYSDGPKQGLPEPWPAPTHFGRKERSSQNRGTLYPPAPGHGPRHHLESGRFRDRNEATWRA